MISKATLADLRRVVGPDAVAADPTDLAVYSYDASLAAGRPEAVVFPETTEQVAAVVRLARAAGLPVVPRGFGTNLSGGSVPAQGGIVVCLTRMNRILEIRPERRRAKAQAGVTNLDLQEALAPLGYFFPPDPASQKAATLGGNVAENSGGPHCLRYGVTTNHVVGLEVVLPDGETAHLGGEALDPPGLDLRGLFVGSEGTLGIATEVEVNIQPLPEALMTFLAIYDDLGDAARTVSDIIASGILPATLEMMDAPVMRAVEESMRCGYPLDAAAVLIIELEGLEASLRDQERRIRDICQGNRCRAIQAAAKPSEREKLWAGRRGAFGALARISPRYLVTDCTVPRTRLPEALGRAATIARRYGFGHGNVFHAGDGNLHPLLFFDADDPDQLGRVHEAAREIMTACVQLGGTITGEHGIGEEKIEGMRLVFSDHDLRFQLAIKKALDPDGLFNPGKVFPQVAEPREEPKPEPMTESDGFAPADEEEACRLVASAAAGGRTLLPVGGGRRARFGNLPSEKPIPLKSERLAGLVEHDPANQVGIFRAGTRLRDAQAALGERGQWLPLRPPLAETATIGGVAALNACGPERLAYGAPRDLVLGLRFVSGEGKLITAGGRVVKNVAGYDITRLMIGSAGSLGFITEVCFRLSPVPASCRCVVGRGSLEGCEAAAATLLRSSLEPVFATARRHEDEQWALAVGFEGLEESVEVQAARCLSLFSQHAFSAINQATYEPLAGFHAGAFERIWEHPFVVRADVALDQAAALARAGAWRDGELLVDFGTGRLLAGLDELPDEAWGELVAEVAAAGGHVVVERAPVAFEERHEVFAPPKKEWELARRLKEALDPKGTFAPGRLPGESGPR